jgi:hypothetical protein
MPPGCSTIDVHAWAAGGGNPASGYYTGGGGGFVAASFSIAPGTSLSILVGGTGTRVAGGVGGGGSGGTTNTTYPIYGGGGRSAISISGSDMLVVGGGGGIGYDVGSCFSGGGANNYYDGDPGRAGGVAASVGAVESVTGSSSTLNGGGGGGFTGGAAGTYAYYATGCGTGSPTWFYSGGQGGTSWVSTSATNVTITAGQWGTGSNPGVSGNTSAPENINSYGNAGHQGFVYISYH